MSLKSGANVQSWFKQLPLSDPRCKNDSCIAFQAAHNASQAAVSYTLQFEYGHWTTWYYLAIIGLFMMRHIWGAVFARRAPTTTSKPDLLDKTRAVARMITYRRLRGRLSDRLMLPSCGLLALFLLTIVLATVATFAVTPYYRGHRGYGSPPIGVRTGLMAVACTPLLVALSGKANIITLLTGISYEKLNVIHRYLGWLTLVLSIAHTIPFLIAPSNDGGPAALRAQFYRPGALEYSGTPPLVVLFVMVLLSVRWIRNRMYEAFWHMHVILAIVYIGLMFWHANQEQDSWAYLWATLAILFASTLARGFYYSRAFNIRGQWLDGWTAQIEKLPGEMTRITVVPSLDFCWKPAQHVYLRLLSIRKWDNHPFTIANAQSEKVDDRSLSFLIRSREGFTRALSDLVKDTPDATSKVWLDGPYGGIHDRPELSFNQFILIAGGAGISACLPWLQLLAEHPECESVVQNVTLLWMVKRKEHISWVGEELDKIQQDGHFHIEIRITQEVLEMKEPDIEKPVTGMDVAHGRPYMGDEIPRVWTHERAFVFVCGPQSLKVDAGNACASLQQKILRGEARQLRFHSETFGW